MASFLEKRWFQLCVHRAYGLGAALVIIGALFKLQHWTGAGLMLTIGMGTECVIFLLSALESMQKQYKWERVYPELDGESFTKGARSTHTATQITPKNVGTSGNMNLDFNVDATHISNIKDGVGRSSDSMKNLTSLASIADESKRLTTRLINANQAVNTVTQT